MSANMNLTTLFGPTLTTMLEQNREPLLERIRELERQVEDERLQKEEEKMYVGTLQKKVRDQRGEMKRWEEEVKKKDMENRQLHRLVVSILLKSRQTNLDLSGVLDGSIYSEFGTGETRRMASSGVGSDVSTARCTPFDCTAKTTAEEIHDAVGNMSNPITTSASPYKVERVDDKKTEKTADKKSDEMGNCSSDTSYSTCYSPFDCNSSDVSSEEADVSSAVTSASPSSPSASASSTSESDVTMVIDQHFLPEHHSTGINETKVTHAVNFNETVVDLPHGRSPSGSDPSNDPGSSEDPIEKNEKGSNETVVDLPHGRSTSGSDPSNDPGSSEERIEKNENGSNETVVDLPHGRSTSGSDPSNDPGSSEERIEKNENGSNETVVDLPHGRSTSGSDPSNDPGSSEERIEKNENGSNETVVDLPHGRSTSGSDPSNDPGSSEERIEKNENGSNETVVDLPHGRSTSGSDPSNDPGSSEERIEKNENGSNETVVDLPHGRSTSGSDPSNDPGSSEERIEKNENGETPIVSNQGPTATVDNSQQKRIMRKRASTKEREFILQEIVQFPELWQSNGTEDEQLDACQNIAEAMRGRFPSGRDGPNVFSIWENIVKSLRKNKDEFGILGHFYTDFLSKEKTKKETIRRALRGRNQKDSN